MDKHKLHELSGPIAIWDIGKILASHSPHFDYLAELDRMSVHVQRTVISELGKNFLVWQPFPRRPELYITSKGVGFELSSSRNYDPNFHGAEIDVPKHLAEATLLVHVLKSKHPSKLEPQIPWQPANLKNEKGFYIVSITATAPTATAMMQFESALEGIISRQPVARLTNVGKVSGSYAMARTA